MLQTKQICICVTFLIFAVKGGVRCEHIIKYVNAQFHGAVVSCDALFFIAI